MERIPTLDGWRGIAILLVLVSHTGIALQEIVKLPHAASIGQHGVAIFFVLSGFLITSRLLREKEHRGSINLSSFYMRRFFRLMPCAWVYLAFIALITIHSHPKPFTTGDMLASIFFFRNYVETSGMNPVTGHFWSLSIEEQFYLVWPSLLILIGPKRVRWVAVAGAGFIALYRLHDWSRLSHLPLQATFGTQYRADALLIGCAAALFLPHIRPYVRGWTILPLLGSFVWCLFKYVNLIPLQESAIIALLLVATSANPDTVISKILAWKPLAFTGLISYSLYIWQQIFLLTIHTAHAFLIAIPLLPAVAIFSYIFIEKPMIRDGKRLAQLIMPEHPQKEDREAYAQSAV